MSGVSTRIEADSEGHLIIHRVQDVQPILDRNKALFNEGDGYSPSREFRRAASIPNVVIEKWLNEEGINLFDPDHWPAVQAKLNSSEYAYLRTAPGRI